MNTNIGDREFTAYSVNFVDSSDIGRNFKREIDRECGKDDSEDVPLHRHFLSYTRSFTKANAVVVGANQTLYGSDRRKVWLQGFTGIGIPYPADRV